MSAWPPRIRVAAALAAAACAAAALALVWRADPAAPGNAYPRCVFHALTGLYCPGCGGLRAVHRLLHGDLLGALRMNALAVVLPPLLAAAILQRIEPRLWPAWAPERASPRTVWAILALLVIFAVVRNVPVAPFALLAPG